MALTDPSEWTQKKSTYGTNTPPVPGTSSGMTNKQIDMSTARNPMNFNMPNQVQPEKPEQQKELKQTAQQSNAYQQQMGEQNVRNLQSKIGGAAYQVQGLVNKFLSKGSANIDVAQTGKLTYKAGDNAWVIENLDPSTLDVSQAAEEKQAELEQIRKQAAPFYYKDPSGRWVRRDMASSVKQLNDYDKLDVAGKSHVDQLIGLTSLINQYEKNGQGNSAEALAIRQQLQQLDKNGTISGMYQAIKDYQKFVGEGEEEGMAWYGDQGTEGQTLEDILNLDLKTIETEIRKAATLSSGLFGGEYESNIKSGIDYESAEGKAALKEEAAFRNKLKQASETYFGDIEAEMQKNADVIKKAFDSAAPAIIESMGNTPEAMAARDFFTQLHTESPQNFTKLISQLLYDPESGLATEQRKILQEYLGGFAFSGNKKDTGKIAGWVNELSTQGYIDVEDSEGKIVKIQPTAEDKYQILEAINKGNTESIKKIIDGMFDKHSIGTELDNAMAQVKKTGDIQGATNLFASSLAKSLMSFATSKTEDAVRDALGITDAAWKNMDQNARSTSIAMALKNNPKLVMDVVKSTATQKDNSFRQVVDQAKNTITKGQEQLDANKAALEQSIANLQSKQKNVFGAVQGYIITNIIDRAKEPANTYRAYFKNNEATFARLGHDQAFLQNHAAEALGMRDSLLNFLKQNPEMYNRLYKGPEVETFLAASPSAAMAMAMDSKSKYFNAIQDVVTNWYTNKGGTIDSVIYNTPTLRNAQDEINGLLSTAEAELAKTLKLRENTDIQIKQLEDMYKKVSGTIFSPDDISRQALLIAQNFGIPDLKELSFGKGYEGATAKDVGSIVPESFVNLLKPIQTNYNLPKFDVGANVSTAAATADGDTFYQNATEAQRQFSEQFVKDSIPEMREAFSNVTENDPEFAQVQANLLSKLVTRAQESITKMNPGFNTYSPEFYSMLQDTIKKVVNDLYFERFEQNYQGVPYDGRDSDYAGTGDYSSDSDVSGQGLDMGYGQISSGEFY